MSKMFGLDCLDRQCNSEVNVLLLLVVVGLVCCFAVGDGVCILWCLFVCCLFVGVGLFVCCLLVLVCLFVVIILVLRGFL